MGLDMFLEAERYISFNEEELAEAVKELFPNIPLKPTRINFEAMYWRKANQSHQWFVDNVQDGNDDCGSYYVSHERVTELLKLVSDTLKNKDQASDVLPPSSGFFFGSPNIDEWYWQDLEQTKKELGTIVKLECFEKLTFHYQSSW